MYVVIARRRTGGAGVFAESATRALQKVDQFTREGFVALAFDTKGRQHSVDELIWLAELENLPPKHKEQA